MNTTLTAKKPDEMALAIKVTFCKCETKSHAKYFKEPQMYDEQEIVEMNEK